MLKYITALAFCLTAGIAQASSVTSTFDTDDEGWTFSGDTKAPKGWNAAGYLEATDQANGGTWYYVAPTKFLGNKAAAFGQTLSYDLYQNTTSNPFDRDELILTGGGLTITGNHVHPGTTFTSYSIALDSSFAWMIGGAAATDAQILAVLSDLDSLWIRGEYQNGSDYGRLDNVVMGLNAVPLPASALLLAGAFAGMGALRRRRG